MSHSVVYFDIFNFTILIYKGNSMVVEKRHKNLSNTLKKRYTLSNDIRNEINSIRKDLMKEIILSEIVLQKQKAMIEALCLL